MKAIKDKHVRLRRIIWSKGAFCLVSAMMIGVARTEQTENHQELASAADWAVITTNTTLLKALLDAGVQVNEPTDAQGCSVLHTAVLLRNEKMVDFLLKNGADRERRTTFNSRLIDIAFETGATNICRLLARTEKEIGARIDGMPREMLEHVFKPAGLTNVVFVEVDKRPPSEAMLAYMKSSVWPNAQPFPESLRKQYEDGQKRPVKLNEEEQSASLFACHIERINNDEYMAVTIFYHRLPRHTPMELVEAIPIRHQIVKRYGYWMSKTLSPGDKE